MYNFCTLFDSNYLSRGLSLYRSLINECSSFTLYIVAFDNQSLQVLRKLNLENVIVISLSDFEDDKLLEIKSSRSAGEYCWTSTPSLIRYCLEAYNLDCCTYLDADLFFFNDPKILLDEFESKKGDVLITEHRYTKTYDQTETSGTYCVQFMSFKNNENGRRVLEWWRDACLEWCFARAEDGKFGDQKYLDDWTSRFKNVVVLEHLGGGVAPWNVQQYSIFTQDGEVLVRKFGESTSLVFYHFHNVKFFTNRSPFFGHYYLSKEVKSTIYNTYLKDVDVSRNLALDVDDSFDPHGSLVYKRTMKEVIKDLWYGLKGLWVKLSV